MAGKLETATRNQPVLSTNEDFPLQGVAHSPYRVDTQQVSCDQQKQPGGKNLEIDLATEGEVGLRQPGRRINPREDKHAEHQVG